MSAAEPAPAVVEFDAVTLTRGTTLALDHVTLQLPAGATTAILGASGSGKSTLVQLAIGLLRPDRGAVRVLGSRLDYDDLRPVRRRIGYAIQDVALLPHLSVRRNIVLPARLARWEEGDIRARVDELTDMMELDPALLDRYPHELSGGQQQRSGLCRAMMLRPELLLLDEPFSGLDAMTRQGIHERFIELKEREPVATLLVTHDPQEAINLASYMVVMRAGRVLQHGATQEIVTNPANDYVDKLCKGLSGIGR